MTGLIRLLSRARFIFSKASHDPTLSVWMAPCWRMNGSISRVNCGDRKSPTITTFQRLPYAFSSSYFQNMVDSRSARQ
jgi:hypothetical protein